GADRLHDHGDVPGGLHQWHGGGSAGGVSSGVGGNLRRRSLSPGTVRRGAMTLINASGRRIWCNDSFVGRTRAMSVYKLAEAVMQQGSAQAAEAGYEEQQMARALMTEVIAVYKRTRTHQDIAHELQFLAENLDEDQDYAFMRP